VNTQTRKSFYSSLMRKVGDVIFIKGPLTSASGGDVLLAPKSQIACVLLGVDPSARALPAIKADNWVISLGGWTGPSICVSLFMWNRPVYMWLRSDQLVHEPTGP